MKNSVTAWGGKRRRAPGWTLLTAAIQKMINTINIININKYKINKNK